MEKRVTSCKRKCSYPLGTKLLEQDISTAQDEWMKSRSLKGSSVAEGLPSTYRAQGSLSNAEEDVRNSRRSGQYPAVAPGTLSGI